MVPSHCLSPRVSLSALRLYCFGWWLCIVLSRGGHPANTSRQWSRPLSKTRGLTGSTATYATCMCRWFRIFSVHSLILYLVIGTLLNEHNHTDKKETGQATEGESTQRFLSAQARTAHFRFSSASQDLQHPELASFERQCLFATDSQHNDKQGTMEMQMVHAFEQNECYALRRLRSSMASLHRLYICARGEKTTRQELGVPCVERKRCKGLFLEKVFGIFASPWRYTPAKEEEQKEQAKEYLPCSRLRSTLELEAQYICPGDSRGQQVGDGRHCRSASTRVDHKAQTLRSRTLARNAEDRGREHSQASDFQTVALSGEKAGSISQQVQAGVESQKESPQFVDRVYRREYKEMDEVRRGVCLKRQRARGQSQRSCRKASGGERTSRRCQGKAHQAGRDRLARHRDCLRREHGRGDHEVGDIRDHQEGDHIYVGGVGQGAHQSSNERRNRRRQCIEETKSRGWWQRLCCTWCACTTAF